MKVEIYVDKHVIQRNRKHGTNDPPISVRTYKGVTKAYGVDLGDWFIGYYPDKPLSCGATVYLQGKHEDIVGIIDVPLKI